MTKEHLIEYMYILGARFGESELTEKENTSLVEKINAINENTSYAEFYELAKQMNEERKGMDKDIVALTEYLKNAKEKEQLKKEELAKKQEDPKKKEEAVTNIIHYENPTKEALENLIDNTKDSAEKKGNSARVKVSAKDDKIAIKINQFGDNITGNEQGYDITYDRNEFNQKDIMSTINATVIGNDKVADNQNQRFYNGKTVQTTAGHEVEIDPNVDEAVMQTEEFLERDKGKPRVRVDDHKNEDAVSNVLIITGLVIVLVAITLIFVKIILKI